LLRRPDIAEAEHQLQAANASIGTARAAFFPNISLTAVAGTMSLGLSNLFAAGSGAWTVTPSATLPIIDFGRREADLNFAKADRDAAVARYEKAVQTGFREVADALARRASMTAQLEAQRSLREAASVAYRLSEARYRTGIDPFLNTLDSQRSLYAAEKSLIATRLTRETNLVELYRSLGGGLQ
jgi:multidrug efflux system outer membrane protein